MNIHPVYRLSEGMRIILEHDVADMDTILRMFKTSQQAILSVLIIHLMNLIDTFQADFHILNGIEEVHELLHRRVELSDDILHGEHHTQGHVPLDYRRCSNHRHNDILHLIDKNTSCLLGLL